MVIDSVASKSAATPKSAPTSWKTRCGRTVKILLNPRILAENDHNSSALRSGAKENIDMLGAQRQELRHGRDRLIDIS
jgi:hypothetical protein